MAKFQASWKSALTPEKAPTYGNQGMLIASPKELQLANIDYVVVFEGTKKYHITVADFVNPYTLHVIIPEHDIAEDVSVKVYMCQERNVVILTHLKFTYTMQMEHVIAKFLAQIASDTEISEKLDAVWTVCLGKDHPELWDKRLSQAFAQLELPIEWTLVGDILQIETECQETLLHFAAAHGLKELIKVFLNLPGAKQALSMCNKSGLLPRDVARESGRLDIAEVLDSDRSGEQKKIGIFRDNSKRQVRKNKDSGITTITNSKSHNIHDDILFLRDLNKIAAKRNSPEIRHSWPTQIQSFYGDENLMRLRGIREEISNLRSQNAEETSKEMSIFAHQNRRPGHSRRFSCPASFERHKRPKEGFSNIRSLSQSRASHGDPEEKQANCEPAFSTPPDSPDHVSNLALPTATLRDFEDTFADSFMTPPSNTPSPSPIPQSPSPMQEIEKRPNAGRKGRPRTWYGGSLEVSTPDDEEFRRSNSLEDFAKAIKEGSDDESIVSETNPKEGILHTMLSSTEKERRTESSSISDVSVGKESDILSEHDDSEELEDTPKDIDSERIQACEPVSKNANIEGTVNRYYYSHELGHTDQIPEGGDSDSNGGDILKNTEHEFKHFEPECMDSEDQNRKNSEHESGNINRRNNFEQESGKPANESKDSEHASSVAGRESKDSVHESVDAENELCDFKHESGGAEHERNSFDLVDGGAENQTVYSELEPAVTECEHKDSERESGVVGQDSTVMKQGYKICEDVYKDSEQERNVSDPGGEISERACTNKKHEFDKTEVEGMEMEVQCYGVKNEAKEECKSSDTEQRCRETGHETKDTSDFEQSTPTATIPINNIDEHIVSEACRLDKVHKNKSQYENSQHDDVLETRAVCNGLSDDVEEIRPVDEQGFAENENHESVRSDEVVTQDDDSKDLKEEISIADVESSLKQEDKWNEPLAENYCADPGDSRVTKGQVEHEVNGDDDDMSIAASSKETDILQNSNKDGIVKETSLVAGDQQETTKISLEGDDNSPEERKISRRVNDISLEVNETSPEGNEIFPNVNETSSEVKDISSEGSEDGAKESKNLSCKYKLLDENSSERSSVSGNRLAHSEDYSTDSEACRPLSEDHATCSKVGPTDFEYVPKDSESFSVKFEVRAIDSKKQSADSENFSTESDDQREMQTSVGNDGPDDVEDKYESTDDSTSLYHTKITYEELNDVDCEVRSFCLPGKNTEANKALFRVQATDDVESGEESDQGKRIRFEEKSSEEKSPSPLAKSLSPSSPENSVHSSNRAPSSLLLRVKTPAKRSESNTSLRSLQDVQFDLLAAKRDGSVSPGALNNSRRAKSFGDLSTFTEGRSTNDDGDDSEEERKRTQEDHKGLSRLKEKGQYASIENLNQISNSRVTLERDDEKQRRWSNFFTSKKPSRTPSLRRGNNLRSSASSIGKGSRSAGKSTIETLVTGQHSAMFARHSSTAPSLQVTTSGRPRSFTRDSPGSLRKSPTVNSMEFDEAKGESPEEAEMPSVDMDFDVDSDLEDFSEEPEAWSVTVEKDMLKKMKKIDIKRQDVIMELIKTEKHHVRTLKIMQQVFYRGLGKLVSYPAERLDQLFPRINDLVDISARFHRNLRCRQDESVVIKTIGDVIVRQFSGDNGELVKQAYGEFVSKHSEAVALYKQYFKTDKKFCNFIKKCHGQRIVRRLSVPECFTLVTQRMTKYPPLIEAILKVTKSSNPDYKELQKALLLVKDATKSIDNAIKDYEKQSRLKDIKMRMEKGSVVLKSGIKIKNNRFVDYHSRMIHDGILQWKNARGKLTETHVVLLESMVAFLQENDKKFNLLSIDGKSPCIALKTLMVREVATDKCAIYFVSTSKRTPEMYEFVCSSQKEKRQWFSIIDEAISNAPEDTGDLFHSPEEERRLAEERLKRRNEILEIMKGKDKELFDLVEEKNKLANEMKELWQSPEGSGKAKEDERISSIERARSILLSAIRRTTQLAADSVLIHESHSDSELAAATYERKPSSPKRAETFGGFDRRASQKSSRRATTTILEGTSDEKNVGQRRDSGLSSLASESVIGINTLSQPQEVGANASFQMLEALQWVLAQFSWQETALETLRFELQTTKDEVKKLRSLKTESDKKHFHMKEEHQAELTRQKKAYNDLERTFNSQVSDLKLKLTSQQSQQELLLQNFSELKRALTEDK